VTVEAGGIIVRSAASAVLRAGCVVTSGGVFCSDHGPLVICACRLLETVCQIRYLFCCIAASHKSSLLCVE
jgi:hypothetical protein